MTLEGNRFIFTFSNVFFFVETKNYHYNNAQGHLKKNQYIEIK